MTIAFVQSVSAQIMGTNANTTASISVTAGNSIIIGAATFFSFTSMQDSFDNDVSKYALDVNNTSSLILSRLNFPSSGSYTFTMTTGGGFSSFCVMEFSGVLISAAFDKSSTGSETNTSHTSGATASLSQVNEVAIGVGASGVGGVDPLTLTNAPPWVEAANLPRGAGFEAGEIGYRIVSDGAAQTFTWTTGGNVLATSAIGTYKAAAGGGFFARPYYDLSGSRNV